jgi:succinoglycan biosynthesis transport protein ExoP
MQVQEDLKLLDIFRVLRQRIWLIIGCTVLVFIAVLIITYFLPPVYEATALMLVKPVQMDSSNVYSDLMAGERLALTYSQMLKGSPVLEEVISELDLKETPVELSKKISTKTIQGTQLINLSVEESTPQKAALIANTIARVFTAQIQSQNIAQVSETLKNMQDKVDTLSVEVSAIQTKVDNLSAEKIAYDADLDRLTGNLSQFQNDNRTLQQNYQSMQFTTAQLTDKVHIVETAQLLSQLPESASEAKVTLLIDQSLVSGQNGYTVNIASERIAKIYEPMMKSQSILDSVISQLRLNENADTLAKRISTVPVMGTMLVELHVTDSNPDQAIKIADAVANQFVSKLRLSLSGPYSERLTAMQDQMDQLSQSIEQTTSEIQNITEKKVQVETELASLNNQLTESRSNFQIFQQEYDQQRITAANQANTVTIAEYALEPLSPVQNRLIYLALAVIVGTITGIGLAFFLEQLDDKVRTKQDVSLALGVNTLGMISKFKKGNENVLSNHQRSVSDDFRRLSINLRISIKNEPIKTLLITSPTPSAGKSLIAANLGIALAKNGLKIILIDADLRLPRLHKLFNLDQQVGLSDLLLNQHTAGAIKPAPIERLSVITSGDIPTDPGEFLNTRDLKKLIERLSPQADFIILDCPPMLSVADTTILGSAVDATILVIRSGFTPRQVALEAVDLLKSNKAPLLGVVLNGISFQQDDIYKYSVRAEKTTPLQSIRNKLTKIISSANHH